MHLYGVMHNDSRSLCRVRLRSVRRFRAVRIILGERDEASKMLFLIYSNCGFYGNRLMMQQQRGNIIFNPPKVETSPLDEVEKRTLERSLQVEVSIRQTCNVERPSVWSVYVGDVNMFSDQPVLLCKHHKQETIDNHNLVDKKSDFKRLCSLYIIKLFNFRSKYFSNFFLERLVDRFFLKCCSGSVHIYTFLTIELLSPSVKRYEINICAVNVSCIKLNNYLFI